MTLSAGTKLGPYEILAPLGAGGMGEVYRASDAKLKRDVAIKVLPEAFANDRERMARFEREAQVLASLNHPNIATIYGVEESGGVWPGHGAGRRADARGSDRGRGRFPSPRRCRSRGRSPRRWKYAHEQGHHPPRPEARQRQAHARTGKVKVLDFGLAKALDPDRWQRRRPI